VIQLRLNSRDSRPETRHALRDIVSGRLFQLRSVLLPVFEVGKVETIHAGGMQLQKPRGDDGVFQIDYLAANVAGRLENLASILGHDQALSFYDLAVDAKAAVYKGGEEVAHAGRMGLGDIYYIYRG
jgi:hypothetical protein